MSIKKKKKTRKYYDISNILSKGALYNLIIGERSNGKTYGALLEGLKRYFKDGSEIAYIRRWDTDLKGVKVRNIFEPFIRNQVISELSNGEWSGVYSYGGCWYLAREDEKGKKVHDDKPFCWGFSINEMERTKGNTTPNIRTVIFDEFMTRKGYLPDEFILFENVLSTIIRDRDDVTIFMLANTVNKYCPYFTEMGLKHIKKMNPGDLDVYKYTSGLKVAVEFSDSPNDGKPSDIYFAFDNPKLKMITSGTWEIDIYPHLPVKYLRKDIVFKYFIIFEDDILQADIVIKNNSMFTFIHKKTTEIQDPDNDIVLSLNEDYRPNWFTNIFNSKNKMVVKILTMFNNDKVFYQDNEIGEVVNNFMNCMKTK